jgi:hypothetical protein
MFYNSLIIIYIFSVMVDMFVKIMVSFTTEYICKNIIYIYKSECLNFIVLLINKL